MSEKTPALSVKKSKNVKRAVKPPQASKYDPIIDKMNKLKPGQTLVLSPPRGVTAKQLRVRLCAIEDKRKSQGLLASPSGYRFTHYQTEDGDLAVELVEE